MNMVSIVEGEEPENMVSEALELLGGIDRFIKSGDVVFIKPNVCGGVIGKKGSYTSPEVISALIELLKGKSSRIIVGEGDSEMYDADRMLSDTGIRRAAEDFGAEVVNLSVGEKVKKVVTDAYMLKEFEISKTVAEADKIICVPVAKAHSLTDVSLSLKCMFGALPEKHKAKYHKLGINKVIADIVKVFPPLLSVVDATTGMEGEGPFKGTPITLNLIICGDNAVAADSVTASVLGYKPAKIKHLELAAKSGLGPVNLDEIDIKGKKEVKREFKKAPVGIRFGGEVANIFRSLIPEKGMSNFFHNYYESAVEAWQKKNE
ncbi:hypothetical protein C5S35_06290 [Candidatus Methanophagaceae archaeon]|nr:hypothetical protein C5S35_06290 [Methanophagales archaeon]